MKNWVKLVISLVVPQAVAGAGAFFTTTGIGSWYRTITKPEWNPPNWVFGPVWTALYLMMGFAFYLVWKSDANESDKQKAVMFWSIQLGFNFLWSFIFFNQHLITVAFVEILVLWLFILLTIFSFAKISKLAAWLLVPYISWVSFAAMLNFAIMRLNN